MLKVKHETVDGAVPEYGMAPKMRCLPVWCIWCWIADLGSHVICWDTWRSAVKD